ncbi:MAG: hypothetical protein M1820_002972 [Bogoriella megaspora]|nr:MAG: hypothetical protein M1820_002972 [Bogoriella megaspora]
MTDVARRSHGSYAIGAESSSARFRRGSSNVGHPIPDNRDMRNSRQQSGHIVSTQQSSQNATTGDCNISSVYTMRVAVQPPNHIQIGQAIFPGFSVHIHFRDGFRDADDDYDIQRLLAVVSLVTASDSSPPVPMPRQMLSGQRLVDSVQSTSEIDTDSEESIAGTVTFPGLIVRQRGRYRLRTTLLRLLGPESYVAGGGAENLQAVDSDIIVVS